MRIVIRKGNMPYIVQGFNEHQKNKRMVKIVGYTLVGLFVFMTIFAYAVWSTGGR